MCDLGVGVGVLWCGVWGESFWVEGNTDAGCTFACMFCSLLQQPRQLHDDSDDVGCDDNDACEHNARDDTDANDGARMSMQLCQPSALVKSLA